MRPEPGIVSGLHARHVTGRGLQVETSLFHAQLSLLSYVAAFCLFSGEIPPPMGSGHIGTVPSQVFKTKDSYIAIDAGFNHLFTALCQALGKPELAADKRFVDRPSRSRHRHQLIPMLETALVQQTTQEWLEIFDRYGIPCGPVNNAAEALNSPQSVEYQAVKELPYKRDRIKVLGTPIWFENNFTHPMAPPPALGEHTAQVLVEILEYGPKRIAELVAAGAIHVAEGAT